MRVLIAGCGYVGTALGERLVAAGHEVIGLRRDPDGLPGSFRHFRGDLTRHADLERLPSGIDAVAITVGADERDEAAYRAAYVTGPATLLGALHGAGHHVQRIVFTSSTAVYGQADGEEVDEDAPTEPHRFSGRILLEAEQQLLDGPFPATVLRLGGIYGPGRTRLLRSVRDGRITLRPDDERHMTNRIHRDDAAAALQHVLGLEDPADVYLCVDDEPTPYAEVVRWLAERLGAPDPPVDRDAPGRRAGSKRCSNRRLRASGWAPTYPSFRDGYDAILQNEPDLR